MSRRRKRSYTLGDGDEAEPNAVGMSGWLFTDLLLALLVVFVGAITISVAIDDGDDEQVSLQEKLDEKNDKLDLLENEKNQEIKNLQDKILELEAEIVELRAENNALQAEIVELQAENARLDERNIEQCWYSVIIEEVPETTGENTLAVAANIKEQIRNELEKTDLIDRKVGLAFLFGAGENGLPSKKFSRVLKSIIEENDFFEYPEFNEAILRPFWSGTAPAKAVKMDLYFFTSSNSTKQDGKSTECKTD